MATAKPTGPPEVLVCGDRARTVTPRDLILEVETALALAGGACGIPRTDHLTRALIPAVGLPRV